MKVKAFARLFQDTIIVNLPQCHGALLIKVWLKECLKLQFETSKYLRFMRYC